MRRGGRRCGTMPTSPCLLQCLFLALTVCMRHNFGMHNGITQASGSSALSKIVSRQHRCYARSTYLAVGAQCSGRQPSSFFY